MRDQQRQQKAYSLILPPINLYERQHTSNHLISKYINMLQHKKSELYQHLKDKEPYNRHQLEYVKGNVLDTKDRGDTGNGNQAYKQELLARGSLEDEKVYAQVPSKYTLYKKQLYSTIQPKIHRATKNRVASKMGSFSQKQEMGYSQNYQSHKRSQTEPHRTQQSSRVDRYRLFSFEPQKSTIARGQGHKRRLTQKHQQSTISKTYENIVQSQQAEVERNTPIKAFQDRKEKASEKRLQESEIRQFINVQKKAHLMGPQNSLKLMQFYQSINALKKLGKTTERLQKTVNDLQGFNPLFKKLEKIIGVCLLRIGKILKKQAQSLLYQMKVPYRNFFIILAGKAEIKSRQKMHKICQTGQTMLQEILFEEFKNGEPATALQRGKLVQQTWILQVDLSEFIKLQRQLVTFGFRRGFNEFKNMLRRNYLVKNWLRNKFKHIHHH